MFIIINGPCGVGKTTVAKIVQEKLGQAIIYDMELVGRFLQETIAPIQQFEDFREMPGWIHQSIVSIRQLRQDFGSCKIILPVSIYDQTTLESLLKSLCHIACQKESIYDFLLTAPEKLLLSRLLERGQRPNDWSCQQAALRHKDFFQLKDGIHIPTQDITAETVAGIVLHSIFEIA